MSYGHEFVLDLYECDMSKFNRDSIREWLKKLCELIGMEREDLHFWDYEDVPESEIPRDQPHLVGTSAVQFIITSDVVIHTIDMLKECYVNVFSCKKFDPDEARDFTVSWFGAKEYDVTFVTRGKRSGRDGFA